MGAIFESPIEMFCELVLDHEFEERRCRLAFLNGAALPPPECVAFSAMDNSFEGVDVCSEARRNQSVDIGMPAKL